MVQFRVHITYVHTWMAVPTVQIFSAGSREGGASANVAGADFHLVIGAAEAVDMTLTGSIAAGRASNWDFRPITGSGVLVSGTIETLSTVYAGSATMFFAATNDAPNDQPAAVSVTVTMTGTPLSFTPFSPIVAGDWTFALLSESVLSVSCARVNTAPLAWCSLVVQGGPVPLACTVTPASSPTTFGVQAVAANVSSVTAPAACFGPGTLVWLADGTQCAIELLRGQVSVLAVAPNGTEWEAVPVVPHVRTGGAATPTPPARAHGRRCHANSSVSSGARVHCHQRPQRRRGW